MNRYICFNSNHSVIRNKVSDTDIVLPYILGYKSHFFHLKIGSKIECVLYVGNAKMYKFFTVYIDLQVDMSVNLLMQLGVSVVYIITPLM